MQRGISSFLFFRRLVTYPGRSGRVLMTDWTAIREVTGQARETVHAQRNPTTLLHLRTVELEERITAGSASIKQASERLRLKRIVADQALDLSILKEVASGNF